MSIEDHVMNRLIVAMVVCAGFGLTVSSAWAGPCSSEIVQLEGAVARSATYPDMELTLPQTVGAQLGHQPTPASVEQAQKKAQSIFTGIIARAKRLDRMGDRANCMQAVRNAKNMIEIN
jgi:hypothetical protein